MAMTLISLGLVVNGLASSLTSGGHFEIRSSGMISTDPDSADVSQCENLFAPVNPVGMLKSLTSSSVEPTERADTIAQRRHPTSSTARSSCEIQRVHAMTR
jgi:hypothetical protein